MNEARLARLRGGLGWLAAAFCLCAGLGLADSFIDSYRTGPNTFSLLPGGTESLSGPLPPEVESAGDMAVTIDRPGLTLDVTTQKQGFWLGNRMWQGTVRAAPDASPGTATVILRAPEADAKAPVQAFVIRILPDAAALDAATNSRIRHAFGVSPMTVAGVSVLCAALVGLAVYRTSRRLEAIWAREGKAVVYMTKKTPDGLLISFGLGADHGLSPGAPVAVHDESGLPVALATVVRCSAADAAALVTNEGRVALGNIVSRAAAPTPGDAPRPA